MSLYGKEEEDASPKLHSPKIEEELGPLQLEIQKLQKRIKEMELNEERSGSVIKSLEQENQLLEERNKQNEGQLCELNGRVLLGEIKVKEELKKNGELCLEIQMLSQITANLREDNGELNKLLQSSPQEILCIYEQLKKHHSELEDYKSTLRILNGVIEEKKKELDNVNKKMKQFEEMFCSSLDDSVDENRTSDIYTKKLENENKLLKLEFSNANYKLKELKGKKADVTFALSKIRNEKDMLLREIDQLQSDTKILKDENRLLRLNIENHKEKCPLHSEIKNNLPNTKSPRDPKPLPLQEIKSPFNSKKLKPEDGSTPTKKKSRQKSISTPKKSPKSRRSNSKGARCSDQEISTTPSINKLNNQNHNQNHNHNQNQNQSQNQNQEDMDPFDQFVYSVKTFALDLPSPPMEELSSLL